MKLKNLFSFVAAFALLFCATAFASPSPPPSNAAANTAFQAEKSTQNAETFAVVIENDTQAAQAVQTNYTEHAPPVVLPDTIKQVITQRLNGYEISRIVQKIPVDPPIINSIGRSEPDYVPLN